MENHYFDVIECNQWMNGLTMSLTFGVLPHSSLLVHFTNSVTEYITNKILNFLLIKEFDQNVCARNLDNRTV